MSEQATSVRKQWEWPTREQFLKSRNGPYWDRMDNLRCSQSLLDYATGDEIRRLRHVLRECYRVLGGKMRQIKAALGPQALQQPGEGWLAWFHHRVAAMSADDQARVQNLMTWQRYRQDINHLLRTMDRDQVPIEGRSSSRAHIGEMPPLLVTIQERYETAYRAALAARWAEIDDADWQRELQRRVRIEADN